MSPIENTIKWCREERARLQRQLYQLQSGQLKTGEKRAQGTGWVDVDTTTESTSVGPVRPSQHRGSQMRRAGPWDAKMSFL